MLESIPSLETLSNWGKVSLPIVPLTEWYRLRKHDGPESTRNTYLACLQPFLAYLEDQACPWNAPPEQLRPVLIAFHRDRLGCQIHPGKDKEVRVGK
jgi:hypothetical protein